MAFEVGQGFSRQSAKALDDWSVQQTTAARDAIPAGVRYSGMEVWVVADLKKYVLKTDLTNTGWTEAGGAASPNTVQNTNAFAALDNMIARFDGTTGKLIKAGTKAKVTDAGGLQGIASMEMTPGTAGDATTIQSSDPTSGVALGKYGYTEMGFYNNPADGDVLTRPSFAIMRIQGTAPSFLNGMAIPTFNQQVLLLNATTGAITLKVGVGANTKFASGAGDIVLPAGGLAALVWANGYGWTIYGINASGASVIKEAGLLANQVTFIDPITGKLTGTSRLVTRTADGGLITRDYIQADGGITAKGIVSVMEKYTEASTDDAGSSGVGAVLLYPPSPVVRLTNTSLVSITGISNDDGYAGRVTYLNETTVPVTILNNAGTRTDRRILTGAQENVVIPAGGAVIFYYDTVLLKWRLIARSAGNTGVTSGVTTNNNAIPRWDGLTGRVLKNSGIVISDNNELLSGDGYFTFTDTTKTSTVAAMQFFNGQIRPAGAGNLTLGGATGALFLFNKVVIDGVLLHTSTTDGAVGANQTLTAPTKKYINVNSASTLTSIDMIPAGLGFQEIVLVNQGTTDVTVNNLTGATAANQINTQGTAFTLKAKATAQFTYDQTTTKWILMGGGAASSGGTLTPLTSTTVTVPLVTPWVLTSGFTLLNFGNATSVIYTRWVGETYEIDGTINIGSTPPTGTLELVMPSGLTSDTAKLSSGYAKVGSVSQTSDNDGSSYHGSVYIQNSGNSFRFQGPNVQQLWTATNPRTLSSSAAHNLRFQITVPIQGRSATEAKTIPLTMAGFTTDADIAVKLAGNAGQALTADTTNIPYLVTSDPTGAWNGTSFTIPTTGNWKFAGGIILTGAATGAVDCYVNGALYKRASTPSAYNTVVYAIEDNFTQGQVVTFRYGANGTLANNGAYHYLNITRPGSLRQVNVNPNQKATIETAELVLRDGATRGTGEGSTRVIYATQETLVGDALQVIQNATGTIVKVLKNGKLAINGSGALSVAGTFGIKRIDIANYLSLDQGTGWINGAWDGKVLAGDQFCSTSSGALSAGSNNMLQFLWEATEVAVSVSNTLPQFSDVDIVMKAAGNGGQTSASGTDIPFTLISDTNGAWNGTQYTVKETGLYTFKVSTFQTAATSNAIDMCIGGTGYRRLGEFINDTVHQGTLTDTFTAGQVISFRSNSNITLSNSAFLHYLTITKSGKPTVSGIDVSPFVNLPNVPLPTVKFASSGLSSSAVLNTTTALNINGGTILEDNLGIRINGNQVRVPRTGSYLLTAKVDTGANGGTKNAYFSINGANAYGIGGTSTQAYSACVQTQQVKLTEGQLIGINAFNQGAATENWVVNSFTMVSLGIDTESILAVENKSYALSASRSSIPYPGLNLPFIFTSVDLDTSAGLSYNTSTGQAKVLIAGRYQLRVMIRLAHTSTSGAYLNSSFYKNGAYLAGRTTRAIASENSCGIEFTITRDLAVNDLIEYRVDSTNFTGLAAVSGENSYMEITKVQTSSFNTTAIKTTLLRVSTASAQAIPHNSATPIVFEIKNKDTQNGWDATTNTYYIKEDGSYQIGTMMVMNNGANVVGTQVEAIWTRASGGSAFAETFYGAAATNVIGTNGMDIVDLVKGDRIGLSLYQSSGAARALIAQARLCYFTILKVG